MKVDGGSPAVGSPVGARGGSGVIMSVPVRPRSIIFVAVGSLIGAVLLAQPAHGQTFTVSGTVGSSNLPVASGKVFFYATCQDYDDDEPADVDVFDQGHYSVTVPSGTYRVRIDPDAGTGALPSFHNAKSGCDQADVLTVTGNTTVVLVALPEWFNVSGSVASANGPITQASVYFYASCQDAALRLDADHDASLEYGTYRVTVPAGVYRVLIKPSATRAVTSWHDARMTCEEATPVVVSADSLINLNTAALYTVTGSVRSANGAVQSGSVGVYTDCQAFATKTRIDGGGLSVSGTYSVDVPPGTYVFYARVSSPPLTVTSWHGPAMACEKATPVTISADTTLDLTLMGRQRVKGSLQNLKLDKRKALAKRTIQGARVTWTVTTPKVCRVKKSTLVGRREGRCKVRATAPEIAGYTAFSQLFWVHVYKP